MLIDGHNRVVNYLRISVTQRCNFRCKYCMPEEQMYIHEDKDKLLTFEEMFEFCKVMIDEGVNKIRITGGEPLLRKDLHKFIGMLNNYKSGLDLALTTNAYYLPRLAKPLADAGLKRLNISLDTLDKHKAHMIARKDVLPQVLKGIEAAKKVGLGIKLNTVAMKRVNENEILDLLEYAKGEGFIIRYIEYMQNSHATQSLEGLKSEQIQEIISQRYNFTSLGKAPSSPSEMFELEDGYNFGIINPHKHDFCESCNRIRLDAQGLLIPCLYFEDGRNIKEAMSQGDIQKATEILRDVLKNKPEKNKWGEDEASSRAFFEVGG